MIAVRCLWLFVVWCLRAVVGGVVVHCLLIAGVCCFLVLCGLMSDLVGACRLLLCVVRCVLLVGGCG